MQARDHTQLVDGKQSTRANKNIMFCTNLAAMHSLHYPSILPCIILVFCLALS